MKQKLIELLETRGFPVMLQGSMSDNESYPNSFYTFWNFETPESQYYDNDAHMAIWGFWVFFYSTDPEKVEKETESVRKLLKKNRFVIPSRGEDADSGRITHTGRMLTLYYMEDLKNE